MNKEKTIRYNNKGFTLIEIMIVILILSVLLTVAIPSWLYARERTHKKSCISQLRRIKYAKETWALENNKDNTASPTMDNVMIYLKTRPECPGGGSYTIGAINQDPLCSIGGSHVLY